MQLKLGLGLILLTLSSQVAAFDMMITEREFYQLSRSCQLYYSSVMAPRVAFEVPFSPSEIREGRIEAEHVGGAWHYCGGLVWLNRAIVAPDGNSKKTAYRKALLEINFTANKTPLGNPMYTEIKVNQAKAYYYNMQKDRSKKLLGNLLAEFPTMTLARIELARQHRLDKNTKQAIEILQQASAKEFEVSADLNYFLGVYQYHEGNFSAAKKYSDQAYKLGYPLPWLRNKLAAKGLK